MQLILLHSLRIGIYYSSEMGNHDNGLCVVFENLVAGVYVEFLSREQSGKAGISYMIYLP